jgi:hypothetical protein
MSTHTANVRPSRHMGYVQLIRGGEGGYFAVCPSCGSLKTPDRADRDWRRLTVTFGLLCGYTPEEVLDDGD